MATRRMPCENKLIYYQNKHSEVYDDYYTEFPCCVRGEETEREGETEKEREK